MPVHQLRAAPRAFASIPSRQRLTPVAAVCVGLLCLPMLAQAHRRRPEAGHRDGERLPRQP